MFGMNETVGRKLFAGAGDRLLVTSMFMTLQGEGPFRGQPAFFIRLAKCQLSCSFCDTYFDSGDWLTVPDVLAAALIVIERFFGGHIPDWMFDRRRGAILVVTGGEPTLQPNLYHLLDASHRFFRRAQVESNGLLAADLPDDTVLVISPKCREDANGVAIDYMAIHKRNIVRADALKFVMNADPNSPYSSVPDWAHEWADNTGKPVFISPMNIYLREPEQAKRLRAGKPPSMMTMEERSTVDEVISFWEEGLLDMKANEANHKHAANYAIRHGFIFNVQQQLFGAVA